MQRNADYFLEFEQVSNQALAAFGAGIVDFEGYPEAYVLGSHEQIRVTVASQQVRAINLIHAIWRRREAAAYKEALKEGKILPNGFAGESLSLQGQKILIVGCSAAGLTAAAFASQHGAEVVVVDRSTELLSRFRHSDRLIDPRLYEWGAVQPFAEPRDDHWISESADLPLLSWRSGSASQVAQSIVAEWNGWEKFYAINRHMGIEVVADGASLSFRHTEGIKSCQCGGDCLAQLNALADGKTILILALGFGEESAGAGDQPSPSYWAKEADEQKLEAFANRRVLVEGNGDGAITDLFRLLVKDFTQQQLRWWVAEFDPNGEIVKQVLRIELANWERWTAQLATGEDQTAIETWSIEQARAYWELECPALDRIIRRNLRTENQAYLSVRPAPTLMAHSPDAIAISALGSRAFPLNKLILASLIRVTRSMSDSPLHVITTRSGEDPAVDGLDYRLQRTGARHASTQPAVGSKEKVELLRNVSLQSEAAALASRKTQWASVAQANRGLEPAPAAWVPPYEAERRAVFERMANSGFDLVTDLFDSSFQASLDDYATAHNKPDLTRNFFLGSLRTLLLFNHRIFLTDAQLWDGRFMMTFHALFESLSEEEQQLLRKALVIRSRTGDAGARNEWAKKRNFSYGSMSIELNRQFGAFQPESVMPMDEMLRLFASRNPEHLAEIERIEHNWRKTDEWLGRALIASAPWPNASAWNVGFCYENPGQFFSRFEDKRLLLEAFSRRPDAPGNGGARTHLHDYLNAQEAGPKIEVLRDWFDRAYNRMTARSQGATVYLSIQAEDMVLGDGSEPTAEAALDQPLNIETIGRMPSQEFAERHAKLSALAKRWQGGGDVNIKRDVFDRLRPQDSQTTTDFAADLTDQDNHMVKKMQAFSTVERLTTTFIGNREAGPHNPALALDRQMSDRNVNEAGIEYAPRR